MTTLVQFYRRYLVTVTYVATTAQGTSEPRRWETIVKEISEEDAISTAFTRFRYLEVQDWEGWPRTITSVRVIEKRLH